MDAITRKIADYAAGVRFADLTEEVIHAAKQRLLDSLGCALGAYNCKPAQIGRRLAAGQSAENILAVCSALPSIFPPRPRHLSTRQ